MAVLRELLFTPGMIAGHQNCYDRLNPLRKPDVNPVFVSEKPWEDGGIAWGSVIRSGVDGLFKFFYSTTFPTAETGGTLLIDNATHGGRRHICCYAESEDGIHWIRPELNRFHADRFPGNNIIWQWPAYFNDSLSVIEDTRDPDPGRRYKMLIYHGDIDDPDLCGGFTFVSPDGIDWKRTETVFPSQDAECLWQDGETGRYFAFLKDRLGANRSRLLSWSDDFSTWSEPHWIFTPGHGDDPGTNFYNQTAFRMAGRILGFLNVYDVCTQTSRLELIESPDGMSWSRMPSRSPMLEPSGPGTLDGGGVYPGLHEPILVGDEYRYYYYAAPSRHGESSASEKPSLCVAAFEKNRIVGQQTEGEGFFSTTPIKCPGGSLSLNFVSGNPVAVALMRPGYGGEIEGFSFDDCLPVTGDHQSAGIRWKSGRTPAELAGRYVRVAVRGRNACIYSAAFVDGARD